MKTCSKCNEIKELTQFYKNKSKLDGLNYQCKKCQKENKQTIAYKRVSKKYNQRYNMKYKYGITIDEYNQLLKEQNECCAICNKHKNEFKRALYVDHDHRSGVVRGLLCNNCNLMIGHSKDNNYTLSNAIIYLAKK